ncbi:MAG: hypothetical protein ACI9VM_000025 [Candidatus Azotimanducaceae bacterium]|jgi:hypothetical protein
MKTLSEWQNALKKAADSKFPDTASGTFDRVSSLQDQLDDVKAGTAVELGTLQSNDHAHQDVDHRIGALIADALILAEERGSDIELELEKVLAWFEGR